ncbi:BMP family ABC transporter substrate-binding protein [Schlegelella sp. S2-27]|uniref:BMP family ABC transporter substrate-binding protein n=1 Tax=Caldimonas mangrovi TaxID=2944811 RepID=A0ABT0YV07_9BURK|nr:BMP family ABC transporter substrate-binding protein [Caldimonas mangrovi]MCM5682582.1 BMP family ABC transporter substrate-binding protein [Caldimonas mangrovi]
MYKNLRRAMLAVSVLAALLPAAAAQPPAAPLKIGFVFVSPVGEAGWTYQHNLGRLELEKQLGPRVQTTFIENVAEGADAERVIRDLAQQGHRLIFTTSFGYMDPTLKVAADFPQVAFEHMGGYKTAANMATYNARFYEGRYLAGMVAGRMSKTGQAGYVAGFPVPEVVQGLNAFTLGMRAVNPKAQVKVVWLNHWFDPAREREAAMTLVNQGADVITHHSASTAAIQAAEARGAMSIPYHSDMRALAPRGQLTAVTHHWGEFYTRTAREVLEGRWKPQAYTGGLKEGAVRLASFGAQVPKAVAAQVRAREHAIASGVFHPFSGRIVDNEGQVRLTGGTMDEQALATMDYFVEGVAGSFPKR